MRVIKRHGARRRDPVLALAAHERVDIDLFGLQRDADLGGRAENECGVPIRPDPSFLGPETKFRLAKGRLVEIDGHRPGDPPGGRRILAGRGPCQRGCAGESKAANPGGRVAFERAVEFGGRPARPRVHREAERRPFRPGLFRGEPEDDGSIVRAGKLAAETRGSVERRRGRVDLDAGNLGSGARRRRSSPARPARSGGQTRSSGGPPSAAAAA